jgi:hypothetical protein
VRGEGVIPQVDIPPTHIERDVVIAVAGDAAQAGIAVERVPARSVRDQPEVSSPPGINPGQRGIGASDYIFARLVVKYPYFILFHFAICEIPEKWVIEAGGGGTPLARSTTHFRDLEILKHRSMLLIICSKLKKRLTQLRDPILHRSLEHH